MSQPPLPPPLPSPLPVIPIEPAPPMPVQALSDIQQRQYLHQAFEQRRARPGIITAIGVISIVVGSLGILAGGLSALYGGIFYMVSKTTAAVAAYPTPMAVPVADNEGPVVTGPRGFEADVRQVAINGLASVRPLNDARRTQLDALFAEAGQDIFSGEPATLKPAGVAAEITEHGRMPATELPGNSGSQVDGSDYFLLSQGRIEVADDRAVFIPSERSQQATRVARHIPDADADPSADASTTPGSIPPTAVAAAMRVVEQRTGRAMTPAQRKSLRTEFASGLGLLATPAPGQTGAEQVLNVFMMPDRAVSVVTSAGHIVINRDGTIAARNIVQNNLANGTSVYTATATPAPSPFARGTISGTSASIVVVEGILSALLAVYLLIIGILVLRQNPRGRRLHVIYALLKIPLAIVCGIGWFWLIGGFVSSMATPGTSPPLAGMRIMVLSMVSGLAVIYPIALLIAMYVPPLRQYYGKPNAATTD